MPKGAKRRTSDRWEAFEGGEHTPAPDYAMFNLVCKDVATELGLNQKLVSTVYKQFLHYSLKEVFPESEPRSLSDEELLNPRRIMSVPGIASLEVTKKSLLHWQHINDAIQAKKLTNELL